MIIFKVFTGNSDAETIQVNFILPAFHARYVRIHPQSWIGRICIRVELYGCESTGKDEGTYFLSCAFLMSTFRFCVH